MIINDDVVEAFNKRLNVDPNNIKTMTPSQLDRVKEIGTQAENLMKNRDFAYFVHTFKFDRIDVLTELGGHTADQNAERIAIANQLSGLDEFIKSLKRAVYYKNRVVSQQNSQVAPAGPIA
jgi:hypothetical protein